MRKKDNATTRKKRNYEREQRGKKRKQGENKQDNTDHNEKRENRDSGFDFPDVWHLDAQILIV